jgi:hypothetical protein
MDLDGTTRWRVHCSRRPAPDPCRRLAGTLRSSASNNRRRSKVPPVFAGKILPCRIYSGAGGAGASSSKRNWVSSGGGAIAAFVSCHPRIHPDGRSNSLSKEHLGGRDLRVHVRGSRKRRASVSKSNGSGHVANGTLGVSAKATSWLIQPAVPRRPVAFHVRVAVYAHGPPTGFSLRRRVRCFTCELLCPRTDRHPISLRPEYGMLVAACFSCSSVAPGYWRESSRGSNICQRQLISAFRGCVCKRVRVEVGRYLCPDYQQSSETPMRNSRGYPRPSHCSSLCRRKRSFPGL